MKKLWMLFGFSRGSLSKLVLKMKLLAFLMFAVLAVSAADSYSQAAKFSLKLKDATVREVFDHIEDNSEFILLYNEKWVDVNRRVDINVKNETVEKVLDQTFKGTRNVYKIYDRQVVILEDEKAEIPANVQRQIVEAQAQQPQQKQITGKVTDAEDLPLPGVSVVVKGTTIGTVTNADGEFSLSIPLNAEILQFSFVGMQTQEIPVEGRTNFTVSMEEETIGLEEVVAVGYGTMKKRDITGSVVSINEEALANRPSTNLEQMLQGNMAGLSVTVTGNNAEGTRNNMLIRGNNSITASNSPLIILDGVPYEGQLSEINPNDVKSLEVLKDASSSAIYGARGSNGVILITTKEGVSGKMITSYNGYFGFEKMIDPPELMDGKTFYELKQQVNTTTPIEDEGYEEGRNTDWLGIAIRTGKTQQHNFSLRGGSEQTKYYISGSYNNVEGIAINDKFERYLFRINLNHNLTDWLTFGTNTQYGFYDRSGIEADFEETYKMNPLGIPYNEDGSIRLYTWEDPTGSTNPLESTLIDNSNISRRFFTNNFVRFDFPFLDGLSFKINTGYDFRSNLNQTYQGKDTNSGLRDGGALSNSNGYDENWLVENILSYNAEFERHRLFFTALYSAQNEWDRTERIDAQGFPNDAMTYYQADIAVLKEPRSSYSENAHISQMLRLNYSFDSRYLVTFTVRRDGYSAFGKDRKFGLFPSFGMGWNIAEEDFMQNMELLNVLKLRVSYGENGNEAISPYTTLPNLSSINYVDVNDNTLTGFYPNKIGNPNLGWETTKSLNIGLDFNLFNNRIMGLIDVYSTHTYDLLLEKSISSVNGVTSVVENIGETKNRGIEFQLTSYNISKKDFIWKTDFNISHYKNEIVQVGLTDEDGNYIDDIGNKWFIGEPINVNYEYVFDGIWQEDKSDTPQGRVTAGDIKVKDSNGNGVIDASDKEILGQKIPDFTAGMTNTFKYKNWRLSIFLNSIYGIRKKNPFLSTSRNTNLDFRRNKFPANFWTPENPHNEYPRLDEGVNAYNVNFFDDASFLRLQELTFGYTFSSKACNSLGMRNIELFANLKNLFTLTKWPGTDPEFNDQMERPQTRTYQIGLRFSF